MENLSPQGRNLLNQTELEGGGSCTTTRPESMEEVVVGDRD